MIKPDPAIERKVTAEDVARELLVGSKRVNKPAPKFGPEYNELTSGGGGGGGGAVAVNDEGTPVIVTATELNFVGSGVTATDAGGGVATITIPGADTETIQDVVGALLTDSSSIDFTYNDAGNSLTATVITEAIQDIVGALVVDSTSVDFTYDDAGNSLTAIVKPFNVSIVWAVYEGGVVSVSSKQAYYFPFDATITGWYLVADHVGDLVLDIWKDTHANWPLGNSDSIVASAKPSLSSSSHGSSTSLTGWTTSISAGEWLQLEVENSVTITGFSFALVVSRSMP